MDKGIIDPWGSKEIKVDERLIRKFGLNKFKESEIPCNHYLFKRKIIVAHRDFGIIKEAIANKKTFIQITGIASSGPLHLGHKVDIDAYLLFRSLGAKSFFVVSDIDAYVSRPDSKIPSLQVAKDNAVNIISHLLAFGIPREEIYVQSKKEQRYYEFAFEVSKKITENTFKAIYGHMNLGKLSANLLQYSDILHFQLKEYFGPTPTITGIGVEQDPHARACRDLARRLPYDLKLPSFFYFLHQSGLQEGSKMSASLPDTAIFLDDSPNEVRRKINKAFSGGRDSIELHRKLGGIPEKDKAYEILFYHHPDDEFVKSIYNKYKSGEMLTGELKKICIDFLTTFLTEHQEKVKKNRAIAKEIVFGK
ncbi:MAG: tryptophan--tRNA ligase [Candidatus Woesearchaeota archaeon]|nr:MAG: tryptophan--tRNA ligase [Candidatus Woesearchaeota archaeon]